MKAVLSKNSLWDTEQALEGIRPSGSRLQTCPEVAHLIVIACSRDGVPVEDSSKTWLSTVNMTESCTQLEAKIDAQNLKNLKTHKSMREEFLVGLVLPMLPVLRQTTIKRKVPLVASFP